MNFSSLRWRSPDCVWRWFDPSGTQSVKLYPESAENPLCLLIQSHPQGLGACRDTDRQNCLRAARHRQSLQYLCHAGMIDLAVPVFVDDEHIATINCGQVPPEPPTEAGAARLLARHPYLATEQAALCKAYYSTPTVTNEQLVNALRLFIFFADYFCAVGHRLKDATQHRENDGIDKAQWYLRRHFREQISLEETARQVHYAPAYLSTLFRKVAGMTYTDYVQRLRIAEAKRLLATTQQGITEIAGEVGFNSLTHFNRVFRKLEGRAPSSYRAEFTVAIRQELLDPLARVSDRTI